MSAHDPHLTQVTSAAPGDDDSAEPPLAVAVVSGPEQGKLFRLAAGVNVIGKSASCSVCLTDDQVSRQHLELTVSERGVTARDVGSKNGSYFNGCRFTEIELAAGALVRVGRTELKLLAAHAARPRPASTHTQFGRLLGRSLRMRQVFALLERMAPTELPILISGETGTGKELCAEAIHQVSRPRGTLVVCDLAGVPRSLIESELFGHVRGSFTGAVSDRDGAFQRADGGTIFLDEVGELELPMQPRLLRALEQRSVKRVGDARYRSVDARIVSATNRDLTSECRAGRFREDLYHRLATVHVVLPPLRERLEDIALLVEAWLAPIGLSAHAQTLERLAGYAWPGNVRELRNVIHRSIVDLTPGARLMPEHLDLATPVERTPGPRGGRYRQAKDQAVAAWERAYVEELLTRARGNVSRAAREAGMDRAYLHRLIRRHGLRVDDNG